MRLQQKQQEDERARRLAEGGGTERENEGTTAQLHYLNWQHSIQYHTTYIFCRNNIHSFYTRMFAPKYLTRKLLFYYYIFVIQIAEVFKVLTLNLYVAKAISGKETSQGLCSELDPAQDFIIL